MKKPCKHKFQSDYDATCCCAKCGISEESAELLDLLTRLKDVADYCRVWDHGFTDVKTQVEAAIQEARDR